MAIEWRLNSGQILLLTLLFCGYTVYMLNRNSFAYNIPNIKQAEKIDSESIGVVTSSLALGYAIGKFVGGILVDFASPRLLFPVGLVICGLITISFSFTSSSSLHSILWLANGLFQGFGWPSCVKLIQRWCSPSLFGTLWSLLGASVNFASVIGPFICNALMDSYGSWRVSMRIFGVIAFFIAAICFMCISDSPREESFDKDRSCIGDVDLNTSQTAQVEKPKLFSALHRIVISPFIYISSMGFLACYLCKGVMSDWGSLYLITEKNATREMAAGVIAVFEVGGIFGNFVSGALTDWIKFKFAMKETGHPRNIVILPFIVILTACLAVLCNCVDDMSSQYVMTLVLGCIIGFTLYSLITVLGVMVVEVSESDISGTSHAVAALFGNLGLIISGLPFTILMGKYSWSSAFAFVEALLFAWFVCTLISQFMRCKVGQIKRKTL